MSEKKLLTDSNVVDADAQSVAVSEPANGQEITNQKPKQNLPRWAKKLIRLLIKVLVIAAAGLAIWRWVGNIHIIHDNNMYPNVKDGDLLVTYKLQPYVIDDVVLYQHDGLAP